MGCGGTVPMAFGKVVHDGFVTLFECALDVLRALPFGSNRCMNDETKRVPGNKIDASLARKDIEASVDCNRHYGQP